MEIWGQAARAAAFGLMAAGMLGAGPAAAVPVAWADWTLASTLGADGSVTVGAESFGVSFSSSDPLYGVQTGSGTNYFTGAAYTTGAEAPDTAPPAAELIQLGVGGERTISFRRSVRDIYLAIVSWNVGPVTFSAVPEVVSIGTGYWGAGTATVAGQTVSFTGEPHGVLRFTGGFTSISFTTGSEYWHGLTVGVGGLTPEVSTVPLPAGGLLLLAGLGGLGALRRRRA